MRTSLVSSSESEQSAALTPDFAAPLTLPALLNELETVLAEERIALRQLDRDRIAFAAEEKLRIDGLLNSTADTGDISPEILKQVERIRHTARINQILIVHARSCVQGLLQMLTGRTDLPVARSGTAPPPPVALNMRG